MSVAHALLRATSALVPTLGWQCARDITRSRTLFLYRFSSPPPSHLPTDRWLFLTWHLYGSLPQAQYPPPHHLSAGRAFVWMDRYLDRAEWGLGFFSTSPSPRSSLPLCGAAPSWVITNSARLRSWLTTYTSCCCHGSLRAGY